jgi:hypothetical protein
MAELNDIQFVRGEGGLGRPLPGQDHFSGLVVYKPAATLPSGFAAEDRIKEFRSLSEAEDAGITAGDANWGSLHYQISECFRMNRRCVLFVMIAELPVDGSDDPEDDYDFNELVQLQNFANNRIRQTMIIVDQVPFNSQHATLIQSVLDDLFEDHKPMYAVLAPDISDVTDLSTLDDLRALDAPEVSVLIGQDGDNLGASLFDDLEHSVPCAGALLGAISLANVHECIGWVAKFPLAAAELDVPALANGVVMRDLTTGQMVALNEKGYIFLRKYVGNVQTYFQDSHSAVLATSDYAHIEESRVFHKAVRQVYAILLPDLNGPVFVDPDSGQLTEEYIAYLAAKGDRALGQMERNQELSGFQTIINPVQDVLATGEIEISIEKVPTGVSRKFKVKLGFVKQLSS